MYKKERNIIRTLYMDPQGLDSFKLDLGVIPGNEQLAPYSDEMEQFNPSDFPGAEREGIDPRHDPTLSDFSRSQIPNSENLDQVPPPIALLEEQRVRDILKYQQSQRIPHNMGFRPGQGPGPPQQPSQLQPYSPYPYSPPMSPNPLTTYELESHSTQQANQLFGEHGARPPSPSPSPSPYGGNMKKNRKTTKFRISKKSKRTRRKKRRVHSRKN